MDGSACIAELMALFAFGDSRLINQSYGVLRICTLCSVPVNSCGYPGWNRGMVCIVPQNSHYTKAKQGIYI